MSSFLILKTSEHNIVPGDQQVGVVLDDLRYVCFVVGPPLGQGDGCFLIMRIFSASFDLSHDCFLELGGVGRLDDGGALAQRPQLLLQDHDLVFEMGGGFRVLLSRILVRLRLLLEVDRPFLGRLGILAQLLLVELVLQRVLLLDDVDVLHLEVGLTPSSLRVGRLRLRTSDHRPRDHLPHLICNLVLPDVLADPDVAVAVRAPSLLLLMSWTIFIYSVGLYFACWSIRREVGDKYRSGLIRLFRLTLRRLKFSIFGVNQIIIQNQIEIQIFKFRKKKLKMAGWSIREAD